MASSPVQVVKSMSLRNTHNDEPLVSENLKFYSDASEDVLRLIVDALYRTLSSARWANSCESI